MKILIVEDEALLAMSYRMALSEKDCEVIGIAATAEEAIRLSRQYKPEVILMDIKLKGNMDGIEAAKEILSFIEIPIIFMTGNADKKTKKRAQSINPKAYLEKPIDCEMLHKFVCLEDA